MADHIQAARGSSELSQALGDIRSSFLVVFLFSVVTNILMLAFPIYMLQIYDRVLTTGHTDTLAMLTLIVVGAMLLMAAIDGLRSALTLRIGGWLTQRLGPVYLASDLRARLKGVSAATSSLADLTTLRNFISTQGLTFFCDAPWVPVYALIIWAIHPSLGILAFSTAAVLFVLSMLNDLATRRLLQHAGSGSSLTNRQADAAVRNAEVVMAMGMLPAMITRWQSSQGRVLEDVRRAGERSAVFVSATRFTRLFAQVGVLGLGALLVINQELTAGAMIACSILLGRALAPVEMAMGAWKNFTQARISYASLKQQLHDFPADPPRTLLPEPLGHLTVKHLGHEVAGRKILDDVNFSIVPGDALAVIGPSAAGKSTLCRFLVGFAAPAKGEVRLDDSEIVHWDSTQLGQYLGFLPQSVELFAGTIKENIARMGVAEDDKVVAAARLAHAHHMIQRLPQGYDTVIGDGGAGLSGGQRQRIGLARAVYGRPKLIVLDEPNANLDQAGESALASAIRDLKAAGSTIVMVGHRPSTLAEATKILLLKDGAVQLFGPREQVLGKLRDAALARYDGTQESDKDGEDGDGAAVAHPTTATRQEKAAPDSN